MPKIIINKPMYEKSNPAGYHSVTPSITVRGGAAAIDFYQRAFAAEEVRRMQMPDGKIMHAELKFGDSLVMIHDEFPEWGSLSPLSIGDSPNALHLYVNDVDAVFAQALAAGAEVDMPLTNQFWGDRSGRLKDPFGHYWMVATRVEEVSPEEIDRRGAEWVQKMGG